MDQIVLFGDSLTEQSTDQTYGFAFQSAVQTAYIRRLDVINRGYSGYNTSNSLQILPFIIPPPSPTTPRIRLFSIFLGANDARLPDGPEQPDQSNRQHVSPEQYRANLLSILDHGMLCAHQPQFLLVTPPPVDERLCWATDRANGYTKVRRNAEVTADYARVVREVGVERGVPVVDLWTAFVRRAGGWQGEGTPIPGSEKLPVNDVLAGYLRDGLHFTGEGYKVVFDEWMAVVREQLPDLDPLKLPYVFPVWSDLEAWDKFDGPVRSA